VSIRVFVRTDDGQEMEIVFGHTTHFPWVRIDGKMWRAVKVSFEPEDHEIVPMRGAPHVTVSPVGVAPFPRNTPCDACAEHGETNWEPCPVHHPKVD
jgi:hypothetical protein